MSKVRINDLARELEVKSKAILDALTAVGVTEKKTHSSSIEDHEAEKVRIHLRGSAEASSPSAKSARPLRGEEEIKTKIDLSNISRPGDVLRAITQQKEAVAPPPRPVAPPIVARPMVAPPVARPTPPPAASFTPPATTPAAPPHVVAPPVVERPAAPPIQAAAPPVAAPPRLVAPPPAAVIAPPVSTLPTVTASTSPQAPVAPPRPSAVIPREIELIIQIPLLVFGGFILARLLKGYASKGGHAADRGTLLTISLALYAGALTAAAFAFAIERERLPDHKWERMDSHESVGIVMIAFALGLFGASAWLLKTKRWWPWRVAAVISALLGLAVTLLTTMALSEVNDIVQFGSAYLLALLAIIMALFAASAWSKRMGKSVGG